MARTYAIITPKPCQDLTVAAIWDAYDRRGLRAILHVNLPASYGKMKSMAIDEGPREQNGWFW